jgi:hypothetical protein
MAKPGARYRDCFCPPQLEDALQDSLHANNCRLLAPDASERILYVSDYMGIRTVNYLDAP